MHLLHESTVKNMDDTYEITVHVVKDSVRKKYTYLVGTEYASKVFHAQYRRGRECHGQALATLNKYKLKLLTQ